MKSRARITFWCFAALAGFFQAWAGRFYIEPDGVNYLDIADAYLRGDWGSAINGYWSPLYSWLLVGVKLLFRPSAYWESTALHLLNFVLYLLALASFEFFFRRVLALLAVGFPNSVGDEGVPKWAWWTLGYAAFLLASLRLITLSNDSPDMALAVLLFLAAGLLIDITQQPSSTFHHGILGFVLGIAYLTKSVMFPLSFLYIATSTFARGGWKKPDPRSVAGLAVFLLVSSPFVIALSHAKGRLTFGETGKVAYLDQVTGPSILLTSRSAEPSVAKLPHPIRQLFENPSVYEYVAPFASTYPPWYDASYWWEGTKFRFNLRSQLHATMRAVRGYFRILSAQKEWVAGWLVLGIFAGEWRSSAKRWLGLWFLWLPSVAMLALYALVLVEPRYVAIAMAVVWISLFAALPWPKINGVPRLAPAVVLAIGITTGIALVREDAPNLATCVSTPTHTQWMAAKLLGRLNLRSGDHVAVLGHTTVADYWAHMGGFRIAADVPLEAVQSYWGTTPGKRAEISSTLRALGIKAIVSAANPPISDGWQALGDTGYYVSMLRGPDSKEKP